MTRHHRQGENDLVLDQRQYIEFLFRREKVPGIIFQILLGQIGLTFHQLEYGLDVKRKIQALHAALTTQRHEAIQLQQQLGLAQRADPAGKPVVHTTADFRQQIMHPGHVGHGEITFQTTGVTRKSQTIDHNLLRHKARMILFSALHVKEKRGPKLGFQQQRQRLIRVFYRTASFPLMGSAFLPEFTSPFLMPTLPQPALILASTSPFRRELLARLRLPFSTENPAVDETPLAGESPEQTALRLSEAKARAVAAQHPDALIIGSDQVACLDGQVFGKPGNHERAVAQLQQMRGRTVNFYTGLCLYNSSTGRTQVRGIPTLVTFRQLSDGEIERYLRAETPYNCAGSAKAEGLGISLIAKMEGDDPNALIGLPLIALCDMLRAEAFPIL